MSIDALSWAFNLELPSSGVKLTLLGLANYANDDGEAYPSQKSIAKKTSLGERAIRNHLVTLEQLGLIVRKARTRGNGSYTSDFFTIRVGSLPIQRQILPTEKNDSSQRQKTTDPAADFAAPDPALDSTVTKTNPLTPDFFEVAWQEYPFRPGASKVDSLKAWNARIKSGVDPEIILAGIARYAAYCKSENTDPRFIKQPATFFGPGGHYQSAWAIPPPTAGKVVKFDPVAHVNRNRKPENEPIDITPQSVA